MSKITENEIENLAIKLLIEHGYDHFHGSGIAPDSDDPLRKDYGDVLLQPKLKAAIDRLNPDVPENAREDALRQVLGVHSYGLMEANEQFHDMLTRGVNVTYQKDNAERGDFVRLVDFRDVNKNEFHVVNQFTVVENNITKRLDAVLFVNGLPLVVLELKRPEGEKIEGAFRQLGTYQATIPTLFHYNSLLVIADGFDARVGVIGTDFNRFTKWKPEGERNELEIEIETLINGMLNPKTLLDLVQNFILYEKPTRAAKTTKKLAAYHQYHAVNKVMESVREASSEQGDQKGGIIWHTQGSGKSLSMVFASGKIVRELNNPTILIITDRNDLDDQLFNTFAASTKLLRQDPKQATSTAELKSLLKVKAGGVIFSTIQKFQTQEVGEFEELSDRRNIVVIADEAHRTQYGFAAKNVDDKDKYGNVIGKRQAYGFAKYLTDALPNATYVGFTGTPIEKEDRSTLDVFGKYVDIYDIKQAVDDGATVEIFYESRLAKVEISKKGRKLIEQLDSEITDEDEEQDQKTKSKWTQLKAIIGSEERIKTIAKDIVEHFEERQNTFQGKGMIVAMSRKIAVDIYNKITELKPEWHNDDLNKGAIKVVMTTSSDDGAEFSPHHTTKEQRRKLASRMKTNEDELKLAIVCDMWLTGFDVPPLHTLYVDKPMKGHNLMQAIARVNRVYLDKPAGLIVDYLGIVADLNKALSFYSEDGITAEPAQKQEDAVKIMIERIEIIESMLHNNVEYSENFSKKDTSERLKIIRDATNYIIGNKEILPRFVKTIIELSKAFAIAIPHEKAIEVREKVAFFQEINTHLSTIEKGIIKNKKENEIAIKQVINAAITSGKIIDIFDVAGIKKPNIAILSEEFMMEMRNMKHQNLAFEVLRKIINGEIKAREKKSKIQSRTLMEMLENSVKKYQNKIITASQVIDELIEIGNEIKKMDAKAEELNLEEDEYAFYTAVADNESAREVMGNDKLLQLSAALTEQVRNNTSIDWTIKENVRARLKVLVKRTLRKYSYPPDMEKLATDNIIEQAELLADEISSGSID